VSAAALDGEAIYNQRCAVCHSIGGGRMAGPDLKDVDARYPEQWIIEFTQSAKRLIDAGDAQAKKLLEEYKILMPDQNLSVQEVKAVLAYIKSKSSPSMAKAPAAAEQKPKEKSLADASADEIASGRRLFTGAKRFGMGGASCVSCHAANHPDIGFGGGKLARDLTDVYSRMPDGVKAITESPPFPSMEMAYRDRPLTDEEVFQVTAFLKQTSDTKSAESAPSSLPYFALGGVGGFGVVLLLLNFVWSKRKILSTKHAVYERQIKSI
jgi:mono/diheme cytochrome c family protein